MKKNFLILTIAFFVYSCNSDKNADKKTRSLKEQATIDNLTSIGDKSYNAHDFSKAVEYYEKAIKINSKDEIVLFKAAQAYVEVFKLSKAIKLYSKAIDLNPNNPDYFFNRGRALILDKNFNKAIKDFNKVLELKPNNKEAFLKKAYCYYFQNEYNKSLEIIESIIKQTNDFAEVYYLKGLVNLDLESKEQACKDFLKAQEFGYTVEQFLIEQACIL